MKQSENLEKSTLNLSSAQVAEHTTRSRNAFRASAIILGAISVYAYLLVSGFSALQI